MVSKTKTQAKPEENGLLDAVFTSASQIWQAGLGAFSKAQGEGEDAFSKLVQEGADLQKRLQQMAGSEKQNIADTVSRLSESIGKQTSGSWGKLEKVFEDRLARSLQNIGVPTRSDLHALSKQIDALTQSVGALTQNKAAATPAKRGAKAPVKTAGKSAAAKAPARAATKKPQRQPASRA